MHRITPILLLLAPASGLTEERETDSASDTFIEEIGITAIRRDTIVQETPISVTAISAAMVETFGVRNQEDIQNFVPSITIQPYDIAIRGVGRNFRNLSGDPGVALYFNNVYTEDFLPVSTENGFYDLERIEFLRGPQSTLYGRNGIGGAVNFHSKKPEERFSGELRTVIGEYNTTELYGYVTGPILENLNGRLTFSERHRDGFIPDVSGNPDLDSNDDRNVAVAFTFSPSDTLQIYMRGNDRLMDRIISGGGSRDEALVVSENGGRLDEVAGTLRNISAETFGYRRVNPDTVCASLTDRANPDCTLPGMPVFEYNYRGLERFGQRVVPGVDGTQFGRPNFLFGHDPVLANASVIGDGATIPELDGDDLFADTNGRNNEFIDHNAATLIADWELTPTLRLRYIFGYTDLFYSRNTDADKSSAVYGHDFYASQENDNQQHELQMFADIGDNLYLTTGLFYFDSKTDQRLDWFSAHPYYEAEDYGTNPFSGLPFTTTEAALYYLGFDPYTSDQPLRPASAIDAFANSACLFSLSQPLSPDTAPFGEALASLSGNSLVADCWVAAPWRGDTGTALTSGPVTSGTFTEYEVSSRIKSSAVYAQFEFLLGDDWSVTAGFRWATDEKEGQEANRVLSEIQLLPGQLFEYNLNKGALNADGTRRDQATVARYQGFPVDLAVYRAFEQDWEQLTWKLGVDWLPSDRTLVYASATTGYRPGGFNLGFQSTLPVYDSEEILSLESGLKTRLFDDTLELNATLFRYIHENVQVQSITAAFTGQDEFAVTRGSTSVISVPESTSNGAEIEGRWKLNDALSAGFGYSFIDVAFTKEYVDPRTGAVGIIDAASSEAPIGVYAQGETRLPILGQRPLNVPEHKVTLYGSYRWRFSGGNLDLVAAWSWIDEVSLQTIANELNTAPAWARLDARLIWTSADQRFNATLFVNNATNDIGIRNLDVRDQEFNYLRTATPTVPQFIGVDLRYRIGANP